MRLWNHLVFAAFASAKATPFCSSFLGIQTATQTSTVVETTVIPGPTVTAFTTTGTDTIVDTVTKYSTLTVVVPEVATVTERTTTTTTSITILLKRDAERYRPHHDYYYADRSYADFYGTYFR
ncbi:hypothetical protein H2201_005532 [Coniosporium apollinis]|uniref:Uncharacterized protein n=1 Tax=Coniosporium apollinis TaxID=61459 RepID=A0ABQ9NRI1_9PEZI|nr:hypothetical protein H2201_005532 [Coniosporium apollinis]